MLAQQPARAAASGEESPCQGYALRPYVFSGVGAARDAWQNESQIYRECRGAGGSGRTALFLACHPCAGGDLGEAT